MPSAPYSPCRRAGNLLFVSGQLGLIESGEQPDVRTQTATALSRLQVILDAEGVSRSDVVKCTVFLSDIDDWPAMNEVYAEFFGQPYPARSAIQVTLPLAALVEIEAIAHVDGS